jgi:LysM repeat protein
MSTPNPLIPQGSNLEQAARSKSTLSIAAFIAGAHAAVFLGLLLIGCNKENSGAGTAAATTDTGTTAVSAGDNAVHPTTTVGDTNVVVGGPTTAADPYAQPVGFAGAVSTNPPPHNPPSGYAGQPALRGDPYSQPQAQPPSESLPAASSEYTVKSGDIAYNVAKKNGVSLKALKEANSGVDLGKLKVGQKITLPAATAAGPTAAPTAGAGAALAGTAPETSTATTSYTVKGGDTLTRIAKKFGTTSKAIRSANGLQSDVIKVGHKLKIPVKAAAAAPVETAPAPAPAPVPAPGYNPPPYSQPLPASNPR